MHTTTIRISTLLASLAFLGAGCLGTADRAVSDALLPVTGPLDALQDAQGLSDAVRARANEEAERTSNEVGVVMVHVNGMEAPADARLGGMFGCEDRSAVVYLTRETATGDTLRDALATLFAVRETTVNGLHNSLAYSILSVDDIRSPDGVTTEVRLSGQLASAGACDDPRIREQVEGTIRRFRPAFRVFLNGSEAEWRCFSDMSGECA